MGGIVNAKFLTVTAMTVLMWADILALYVLWMTMTYLTNVWKINFTNAAAILNLWGGASLILPIVLAHMANAFVGNFTILVTATISYVVGLGLLAMSTPPMFNFAKHHGTCSDNKPECIGEEQKHLFYIGLGLIAFGMGGHFTSFEPFAAEQLDEEDYENGGGPELSLKQGVAMCGMVIVPTVAVIVIPFIKSWSIRYGIAAVFSLVALLLFMAGCCWYKYVGPRGSSLTTIARVFVASTTKLLYRCPKDTNHLYEKPDSGDQAMSYSRTHAFCCLDKAAIVLPNQPLEEQEKNRWRLCTVTEVEGTKIVLRMIPMWLTFIACGLVSSIGTTYFLEQANRMNPKVGRLKVPLMVLLFFYDKAKQQSVKLYCRIAASLSRSSDDEGQMYNRYTPPVGIAVSMVIAVLCCITAAIVEDWRLRVVASHGLIDKPDERVPMTMFWLVPQFVLLGLLNGLYQNSVDCFLYDQGAASMIRYMGLFTRGVFGAGIMGSTLSVYIVGRISSQGGERRNWFQPTLNKSRLDNYYWVLAAISAVNLAVFGVLACLYRYRELNSDGSEAPDYEETTDGERLGDDARCCCC